nr:MAG TPA: hypothetical protein [Caudoviricetes sp.]
MRIISQGGTLDMPYEICTVWCRGSVIMCDMCGDNTTKTVLATYSTDKKAQKVMEMLRVAYAGKFITNADIPDDFNETVKTAMKGGFGTVVVKDTCERVEFNNLNGYFQFPAEEELE